MVDEPAEPNPNLTDRAQAAQRTREQRLAGALRANLRRRRAPERSTGPAHGEPGTDADKDTESHG